MSNCPTKDLVFKLIEDHTKQELDALLEQCAPMEALYQVLIPTSEEGTKQKEQMLLLIRSIRIAVSYLNDNNNNNSSGETNE